MPRIGTVVGQVIYNGYQFPGAFFANVSARFIWDRSERTVKYVEYTFKIETVILPEDAPVSNEASPVDANIENIRKKLSAPRKAFTFAGQGFATSFQVNTAANTMIDVNYGPKPRILSWEPIGSNKAARIVWELTTCVPECASNYDNGAPLEFNFNVHWSINHAGMTTRTISGILEVAANSLTSQITASADDQRNFFNFPILPGFHREQEYDLSDDKRTLTFRIVDTETASDNPFLPGIVECEADHRATSNLLATKGPFEGKGFCSWDTTLAGVIKPAANVPRHYAWFVFLIIVKDRLDRIAGGKVEKKDRSDNTIVEDARYIVNHIEIREALYRREFRFTIRYLLIVKLPDLFEKSGLFQPLPGDWNLWRISMGKAFSNRGYAGLGFKPSDDAIVNICDNQSVAYQGSVVAKTPDAYAQGLFVPSCPKKEHSWLVYKNFFEVVEQPNSVRHRKVVAVPFTQLQSIAPESLATVIASGNIQNGRESTGSPSDYTSNIIQVRGPATYTIRMWGYAVRMGHTITPPVLESIGGQKCTRIDRSKFADTVIENGPCPMFAMKWDQLYTVENIPGGDITKTAKTNGLPEYYAN